MSQEDHQHRDHMPSSSMSRAYLVSVVIISLGRAFADRRLASVVQRLVAAGAMENQMAVGAVATEMKEVELESLYLVE